ncbi:sigma-70 family RNA polymerase sigma factor [Methylobacterium sp. ID0610]|uniref:sigma-70 family RNA polymerase sigma factor n=1 Tax=Methylobacterium carpenticola TaxID=3344827 RepID=UPI00368DD7BA
MTRTVASTGSVPEDASLLAALVREQRTLVDYAARILRDRASAEDVVQEVAVKLCEARGGGGIGAPLHYLRRMVRNAAIDCARRTAREGCRFTDEADAVIAPCTCPQERLEQCEALRAVMAALSATPARTRRVLLAHRIDGVPQKELAREIGVSPTLVNVMIRDGTALCRAAAA